MLSLSLIRCVAQFLCLEDHLQVIQVNRLLALQEGAIELNQLLFTTAVYKGNLRLVSSLVAEKCVDPTFHDNLGLRWSAYVGNAELVHYFLELGLDCQEAEGLAEQQGFEGIVYLFKKHRS